VFVGLFAFAILFSSIKHDAQAALDAKTLSAIKNLASSPEFYCATSKVNCVDFDKAMALSNNPNYAKFYSFAKLSIIKSSAFKKSEDSMVKCTMANYPDCEEIVILDKNIENKKSVSSYVALCRTERENDQNYQKCELGKLMAWTADIEEE
jgi:hypothetical protein